MATPSHAESRRLYSWWWDSHIIPKHSKWLQDNLVDMDEKITAMIRLLEEDADSFARKAEMYYKKRPELTKLVEEFFRAYRALAERYDHVTGALRQAHRTIAEAFPNQILLDFFDEYISSEDDAAAAQNDACLRQLDQTMATRENAAGANFAEAGEGKFSEYKLLQKEISRLSTENQDLMKQIALESERADKNESEIGRLKESNSRVKSEKEDSFNRYLESLTRISDLETEISRTKTDLQKLTDEITIGTASINRAEERNLELEKANQLLQLELDIVKKKIQQQHEELNKKGQELQILSTSLQDEHQKNVKAEMAFQSMENQRIESLEEMMHLKLELKIGVEKLKDMEEELQKIRGENLRLREEKLSSALKIMSLQDEMISLLDLKRKLEDEADFHIEEKEALDLQLNHLKKDRKELERKYNMLIDEIQAVNSAVESLQALIKDLRDANLELRSIIKNNEDERNLYLKKVEHMQTMSEKISALDASLMKANDELVRLRMKVKELEDSSAHLNGRISIHLAEKAALLSQMEAAAQNMQNLSKKNRFLENSLSDMNAEFEELRGKLKGAEESCMSHCDEKSNLLSERSTLISQVENFTQSLQILEGRCCLLENKSSKLEIEKDLMLHQMEEMQQLLRIEKKEHSILLQSSKSQLSALADQLCILQDQGRQREETAEMEEHQILNSQIEIFILQRCLRDMKEGSLILSRRTQEHQDALQCKEKLILELEQECQTRERKIKSLMDQNNKLRDWTHVIIRTLEMDLGHASLDNIEDEMLLQLIFHEIKHMLHTISESRDEKQHLLLEKSVIATLLQQFGKYVADIRADKVVLESECKIKEQNLALLKCKNDEFLELNELLRDDVQARKQREEALKSEVDLLFRQLEHLQDSHDILQKKNDWLQRKNFHLKEEKVELEELHNAIVAEYMALDCLAVVFRSLNSEREFALSLLSNEISGFYKVKNNLATDITPIFEKIVMLEVENTHLKQSFADLKEQTISLESHHDANCSVGVNQLSLQRDTGENPLIKRNIYLVQSILSSKEINLEISRKPNDHKVDDYEATVTRGLEKVPTMLNDYADMKVEIESLQQLNKALKCQVCEIQKDMRELLHEIQFETVNAIVHKEKVLELVRKNVNLEICANVQSEISQEEITLRDSTINELEKKIQILEVENMRCRSDLNEYSIFLGSLWDDITILEELTLSLVRRHSTSVNQKSEDDQVDSCTDIMSIQEQMKNLNATESVGPLKLQVLHNKVKLLQEVLLNTGSILELERIDSSVSLEAAWREINGLKLKESLDNEITESNYEQFMKDIQLDIVLNSSQFRNFIISDEPRKSEETNEADELMLDLCGAYEEGCSNMKQEGFLVTENNMAHCQIEEVDGKFISDELVTEKELGIDKLELHRKIEPYQEWNRMVIERLFSDARRLVLLKSSVQDLQMNMETSEKISQPTRLELNTIKVQLKEAEGTISELIEVNGKLTEKVEDFSTSPDDNAEKKERGCKQQKQISNRARKVSEKIGRLELEMQKLKYNLLKFEEEHPNKRPRIVKRRPGVRLREYIYGRRNSMRRQIKGTSCGCMRAAENSD